MTRDEIIKGLESTMELISATKNMFKIGFPNVVSEVYDKALDSISDALALLKAQEPIEPVVINGQYECGECRYELRMDADTYCPCCGRMVKWE